MNAFYDFKNNQKCIRSNICWYVNIHMLWKFIQYTIHWDKTRIKKIFQTRQTLQKIHSFFFCELQLTPVLPLIRDSCMSWSTTFISWNVWVGFFIFYSTSFLLKFLFLFKKNDGFLNFKTSQTRSKGRRFYAIN